MWTISNNKERSHLEHTFSWVRDMNGVLQDAVHHAEGDVAVHTFMVLDCLTNFSAWQALPPQEQEILWAAALLHDVEKRSTTVREEDGSITAHGHARKGAITTRQLLYRDVPAPFYVRESVVALVRYHSLPLWLLEKPDPLKTIARISMEVNTAWLAMLARADVLGRICSDVDDLLYRIECFEEFCKEHDCWGKPMHFASAEAKWHFLTHEDAWPGYEPFDKPAMEVVLMSGLPGAGKDSYIKRHFKHRQIISLDAIREEMGISPVDKSGNGRVIQEAKERARVLLRRNTGFVWNATNITAQLRQQLTELFTTYKAHVTIVYVEVPYGHLHTQNRNREALVPAGVIDKLVNKLEVPALWEAHAVIYAV